VVVQLQERKRELAMAAFSQQTSDQQVRTSEILIPTQAARAIQISLLHNLITHSSFPGLRCCIVLSERKGLAMACLCRTNESRNLWTEHNLSTCPPNRCFSVLCHTFYSNRK
jgi:hypothetical protein